MAAVPTSVKYSGHFHVPEISASLPRAHDRITGVIERFRANPGFFRSRINLD